MHRLNEIAARLTPSQLRELEDFAEFLSTRQPRAGVGISAPAIDLAALAGLCEGMGGDKTAVELCHEALAARASPRH